MGKLRLRPYSRSLLIACIFFSCQRSWQPAVQLRPESSVPLAATIPADTQTEDLIVPYRRLVEQRMNEVIGTALEELKNAPVESSLGNFVADLQREQAAKLLGKPVDMGLMTRGGLRYIIPQGEIKVGDVFELMPFENELLVLTLTGATVQKLFAFGAEKKILSISNATFAIQNGQPTSILIGGKPLNVQKNYTLAVSDYLAGGGDNLSFLKEAIRSEKVGVLLRDAILKHIRELTARNKPVEAKVEGRVRVL